jgi:hypothetical protein
MADSADAPSEMLGTGSCPYQLFVRIEIPCFFLDPDPCWQIMQTSFLSLFHTHASALRMRLQLALKILALRHRDAGTIPPLSAPASLSAV